MLNFPRFANIYLTPADVADPVMFLEQGYPLFR